MKLIDNQSPEDEDKQTSKMCVSKSVADNGQCSSQKEWKYYELI